MASFHVPMLDCVQPQEYFATWKNAFSDAELSQIRSMVEATEKAPGIVGEDGVQKLALRDTQTGWIDCDQNSGWIYERLARIGSILNAEYLHLDVNGIQERLQVSTYRAPGDGALAPEGGHYGWHLDCAPHVATGADRVFFQRKMSMVLQLSDPSEYDGGNLELCVGGLADSVAPKGFGAICVFPSFLMHRVTPVTRGRRTTVVAWFSGRPWR